MSFKNVSVLANDLSESKGPLVLLACHQKGWFNESFTFLSILLYPEIFPLEVVIIEFDLK